MRPKKQKQLCKDCPSHWTHGIKDGKRNNWCCHFGNVATKAISRCVSSGYYDTVEKEDE